jgi:hypothetical protein
MDKPMSSLLPLMAQSRHHTRLDWGEESALEATNLQRISGIPCSSQSLMKIIPLDPSGLDVARQEPTALIMSACIILAGSGMNIIPVRQTLPAEFVAASTTCTQ